MHENDEILGQREASLASPRSATGMVCYYQCLRGSVSKASAFCRLIFLWRVPGTGETREVKFLQFENPKIQLTVALYENNGRIDVQYHVN